MLYDVFPESVVFLSNFNDFIFIQNIQTAIGDTFGLYCDLVFNQKTIWI